MVKANAYGHGAIEVSRTLLDAGVERLAVATLDEGLGAARAPASTAPILRAVGARRARGRAGAGRRPASRSCTTPRASSCWSEPPPTTGAAHRSTSRSTPGWAGRAPTRRRPSSWRRGIRRSRHLELAGTFSHLAVPGEDDAYTEVQLLRLAQALDAMRSAGADPGLVHVSATGGILAGAGDFADAIRPGLGLYGLLPAWAADRDPGLRPVLSLKALPLRIFDLPAGHADRLWPALSGRAGDPHRHAGHRLRRRLAAAHANNGRVLVRGALAPIVGAISMDGLTVDLGQIDDVTYGDEFVLIGEQMGARISADEVAAERRTINYEVTTALRGRLPRLHLGA